MINVIGLQNVNFDIISSWFYNPVTEVTSILLGLKMFIIYLAMVNFMCQLAWATGCPDIWPNIIVCVCVCLWGCFWMRLTSESVDWIKQISLSYCEWTSSSQLTTWKAQKGWIKGNSSCLFLLAGMLVFSSLWATAETLAFCESLTCWLLDRNIHHHQLSWH